MGKMKIIIFGVTGFIGRNILEKFSEKKGIELIGTYFKTNPPKSIKKLNVKLIKVDLTNKNQVNEILKGIDIVIQAAAVTTGIKDVVKQPYIHVTDNAVMNSLIFRSCFENKVKHVIFFSCTTMYPNVDFAVNENDFNSKIEKKYFGVGWTKVYIEKMCEFYSQISDTKFTAIRHSNIFGPYDKYDLDRSHVFGATITKVMTSKNNTFDVWGDGSEKRDLLYISDLINFIEMIIEKQNISFELINIGSGTMISIKDLVKKIIDLSGKNLSINYDTSKPTIKFNLKLNIDRAFDNYNWKPKISLEDGISKTINWYKENIFIDGENNIQLKE
tara:strand:+ start:6624 stop:7613 length:990 start_codon:yes stop_codon:yes gene_type:complete